MKWINRIVYALVVAFGMMLVFNIVDSQVRSNVLQEEGLKAIEAGDYDRLLAVRFYHTDKLIDTTFSIGDATFEMFLYDAAFVRDVDGTLVTTGGITVLFHQTGGLPFQEPFNLEYRSGSDILVTQMGFQVIDLPVYSGIDPLTLAAVVPASAFATPLTALAIVRADQTLVSIDMNIDSSDLTVHQAVAAYIAANGRVPKESFDQVGVTPTVAIDTSLHVVFFAALYLIAVAIATYLFFVWKKQKLGSAKPTEGILKDIQNIQR
jgi:hypothetical protein